MQQVANISNAPLPVAGEVFLGGHGQFHRFVLLCKRLLEDGLKVIAGHSLIILVSEDTGGFLQPVNSSTGETASVGGRQAIEIVVLQKAMADFNKEGTKLPSETASRLQNNK